MKKEDQTIFEYRMGKELKYTDMIKKERVEGKFEKISIRTKDCGYIDGYLYRPETHTIDEVLPIVFNFHGGGMVLQYCEQDGKYCQWLANELEVNVINVDYAVAPEYKFPLPVESSYEFILGVIDEANRYNLNTDKVYLMGHSAGGYISAALCVLNNKEGKMNIAGLIADYAVLRQDRHPAVRKTIDSSKAMPVSRMQEYYNWYFNPDDDASNPLASPYNADPSVFPPALIISAEFDSLREEEEEFALKLKNNGNQVVYKCFEGCRHGFTHEIFDEYNAPQAKEAWNLMKDFLNDRIHEDNE